MKRLFVAMAVFLAGSGVACAQDVLTYHNSASRHGAYTVPGLTDAAAATITPDTAFKASVTGHIYAQPLYWAPAGGTAALIVATESNYVYSLNAATGAVIWQTQLPAPATSGLPCGNINPEGVVGTPTIDASNGTLYLDALTQSGSTFKQEIYALSLATGAIKSGWPADVQTQLSARGISFSPGYQGERSGLLVNGGHLYTVFGGKYGDCQPYHGVVVETDLATGAMTGAWETRSAGGGIWSQGGIAADGGSLFVTTGNTSGSSAYGDGESVVRLKAGLAAPAGSADYFAPSDWLTLDNKDLDLGGSEALPVNLVNSAGKQVPRVIALGKDGNAYLVNRSNLGGIGGHATSVHVSSNELITGAAVYSTSTVDMVALTNGNPVGCSTGGIMMLKLAPTGKNAISVAWCAGYSGNGSPIITTTDGSSNPIVWVVGAEGDNKLHGFNGTTGAVLFGGAGTSMSGLRHMQTLIVAGGRIYVAADGTVYAFTFTGG